MNYIAKIDGVKVVLALVLLCAGCASPDVDTLRGRLPLPENVEVQRQAQDRGNAQGKCPAGSVRFCDHRKIGPRACSCAARISWL